MDIAVETDRGSGRNEPAAVSHSRNMHQLDWMYAYMLLSSTSKCSHLIIQGDACSYQEMKELLSTHKSWGVSRKDNSSQ